MTEMFEKRDFQSVLFDIRIKHPPPDLKKRLKKSGWVMIVSFLGAGALIGVAVTFWWLDQNIWVSIGLVMAVLLVAPFGIYNLDEYENAARRCDRAYFVACLESAQNIDEMYQAGLPSIDVLDELNFGRE